MTYQVMARKWRPQKFSEVVAQEHVVSILQSAVRSGRIHHGYLFSGPRGTGKTTCARILAKALNCAQGDDAEPCGNCTSCVEIAEGISPNVIEIDAASNRGIEDVRNLRESIRYAPAGATYKIYVIDEVHQLTHEAFNALLKTLEEPPAHGIFIFATTEPQKVPTTILSRCLKFEFRLIPFAKLRGALQKICDSEKIDIAPAALDILATRAEGSMRDALSLLDQVSAYHAPGGDTITEETVRDLLGLIDRQLLFAYSDAAHSNDTGGILNLVNGFLTGGGDSSVMVDELAAHFRALFIGATAPGSGILNLPASEVERYEADGAKWGAGDLVRVLRILTELKGEIKRRLADPRIALETASLRIASLDKLVNVEQVLKNLGRLSVGSAPLRPGTERQAQATLDFQRPRDPSGAGSAVSGPNETSSRADGRTAGTIPVEKAPTPAASTDGSAERFASVWPDVMSRIKERNKVVFHSSSNSYPERLEGNVLFVRGLDKTMSIMGAGRKGSKEFESAILEVTGEKVKVELLLSEKTPPVLDNASPLTPAELEQVSEVIEKYPEVKTLVEKFNGRVVAFEPSENPKDKSSD